MFTKKKMPVISQSPKILSLKTQERVSTRTPLESTRIDIMAGFEKSVFRATANMAKTRKPY
ncbi:MAG TPA: hypothetical protein DCZ13_01820 [Porticoccaceae bacterium]|nr:hypothetical protein [Porticoccaceae bacterium]